MRKLTSLLVVSIFAGVLQVFGQTAVDPTDGTLISYKLTPAQKAAFSTTDGQIAAFWESDWAGRDYINMTPTQNAYAGEVFTGDADCGMKIESAADETGLYMYMNVMDDKFVDVTAPTPAQNYQYDATDLYFDVMSSTEILALPPEGYANTNFKLTPSSQQFQINMGGAEIPQSISYNYYDPLFTDWTYNSVSYADLPVLYQGLSIEVIKIDETHKAQEWFIPWNYYGTTGYTGALALKHFAFTGGYNDEDGLGSRRMRWKNGDPYLQPTSWGDIEMEAGMPDAVGITVKVVHPTSAKIAGASSKVINTQLFTLRGEKIANGAKITKNSLVLERKVFADGSVKTARIHY